MAREEIFVRLSKLADIKKSITLVASLLVVFLLPVNSWSADFEGDLNFFKNFDWPTVQEKETQKKNEASENSQNAGTQNGEGPVEMGRAAEVTIQLEKKMPAMQGSSDKPFLGPDPMESGFEDDPFATPKEEVPVLDDPLEGLNRSVYKFNDTVYDNLLRPVAETYRDLVHEEVRIAVRNLFNNALAPVKLVSSVVQLDAGKAGRVIGRTVLNTIFGWGGMLDVAGQEYGIKDVNEDFNQALGYHGVSSGPYIVLPFLGPTTTRGVVGRVVDSFLSPTIVAAPGFAVGAALSGSRIVNDTSFRIEDIDALKKDAIDPYVSMRDFYHQYTEGQIKK